LLEQFEDYCDEHQRIVNHYMDIWESAGIYFRVSTRPEGIRTFEIEGTKEKYKNHVTIDLSKNQSVTDGKMLLTEIANKYLQNHEWFSKNTECDIELFLSKNQDYYSDCLVLIEALKHRSTTDNHTAINLQSLINLFNTTFPNNDQSSLDPLTTAGTYLILAKAAKKKRLYYGMRTLSQISNVNIRFFLNVCDRMFRKTAFDTGDGIKSKYRINSDIQTQAIIEESLNELDNYRRINIYGNKIYNMIVNMGNIADKHQTNLNEMHIGARRFRFSDEAVIADTLSAAIMWGALTVSDGYLLMNNSMTPLFGINPYLTSLCFFQINDSSEFLNTPEGTKIQHMLMHTISSNELITRFGWEYDPKI